MAHRSQCSSAGDNPLDPNYLPAHYREEYRLAIDALVEENLEGYYQFLQRADVVDFLSTQEIEYIQSFVQVPHEGDYAEQRYPVSGGDGSSDTYWPIHSDLDAPDLDLGWPQLNRFTGPTEVTTLVNPAEPDMPSIKEQARRLIKNAQQVVAIVMDMFTDVDIFAELLDAAVRNVAVYILLDEQNAHHFINMLSNCRVNLESIQSMRVRTVSGISYQCRSGKSLKGQMMDRFLLTDCRAVLSGNYSFMWSFEKLHRCLAHLFLGQLVSTFDEEFRILFAQSQPLKIENTHDLIEDFVPLPERQYLTDRAATFRDSRKYATIDTPCPEERGRHLFDERMGTNWKKMGLSRHESFHRPLDQGPVDMYKYPSQQFRTDESHDQSSSRILNMLERPAFKRHSYAEGIHGGQTSYQSLQQPRTPNFETPLRQFQRSHPPPPRTGAEAAGYSGYDGKFMSHAYPPVDQHPEPGLPQEIESNDSFDPVLNYLSSTSNVEMEQVVETFSPPEELPFGSSYSGRISVGPPFASETTPEPSEQTQFYQDRKDPAVKQGLRNWRINSYLSAFDNAGDDEMPLPPPHGADPFEESSNPLHHTLSGPDLSITKFSSARESKVPKAGQLLSYSRSAVPEPSEKNLDEFILMAAGAKITPTTSESSFTTETDKTDELEQKEPRPEESFRRRPKAAVQRSSRLRSSLIFGAQLEQPVSQDINATVGQQDDAMDNNNSTQSKLPFASQLSSQWRSIAREPFKWSNYVKPATFDGSAQPSQAGDNKNKEETENLAGIKMEEHPEKGDVMATIMPTEVSSLRPSTSQGELSNIGRPLFAPESMLSNMSEADMRLMFFKELAAKRKAKQAAALASNDTDKVPQKTQSDSKSTTVKSEEPAQKKQPSCENEQSDVTTDSEKLELKKCQAHVSTSISDPPNSQPLKDSNLSHPAVKDCDQLPPATMETDESSAGTSPAASGTQTTIKLGSLSLDSVSKESSSTDPGSAPSISAPLEGNTASPIPSESSAVATPVRLESSSSHSVPSVPSSSSEQMQPGASKNTTDYSTRPLIVRQPFKRSLNVRTVSLDSSIKKPSRADDVKKEEEAENSSENSDMMPTSKPKEAEQAIPPSPSHPSTSQGQLSMIGQPLLPSECLLSHPSVDISNASTLAAEQKTTQAAASESNDADKVSQKTRSETKSTTVTNEEPSLGKNERSVTSLSIKGQTTLCNTAAEKIITKDLAKMTPTETPTVDDDGELQGKDLKQNNQPVTSAGFENTQSKVTTDSEKIERRKSQAHVSISVLDPSNNQPLKDLSHPAVKDCGQPSPATMETAESSTVISPTESGTQSKNELESPTLYSLSKDSCSTDPSTATLPASNSAPLETKTHSSSTPESSVAVNLVRSASSSPHSVPPVPRSQSEIIESNSCASLNIPTDPTALEESLSQPLSNETPYSTPLDSYSSNISHLASSLSSTSDITEPDKSPSPSSLECSKTSRIPPEESAPSSLTQTVSCSDTATINPNSIGVPTEVRPTTLDSSEAGSKSKKPNTSLPESPAETREEPCTPEPTSKTEHPQTDTNSVPLGSSSTAERSSHDDVKDETKTISIIHSPTCSDDPSEHSKTSIHNVPTELVDPPTPNAAENTAIEVSSASKPDFDPSILALAQPTAQAEAPSSSDTRGSVSDSSIVVSKPEKITTSTPHIPSPSESTTPPKLTQSDLDNSPTPSSSEPTSKDNYNQTQDPTDPPLALESPVESESITHDGCPSEPSVAVDKSDVVDGEVSNEPEQPGAERQSKATEAEATNTVLTTVLQDSSTCHQKPSDQTRISEGSEKAPSNPLEAVPSSPQSKQPKVSQSRYHSSTANVLSSSNLRDDTKLLLGQISANSQNRNEPPKELAVTDDDKEGEAEKNASGQKDGGSKYLNRGATKPTQDREKLLQRIQTMRKERKVYSRFEIPP